MGGRGDSTALGVARDSIKHGRRLSMKPRLLRALCIAFPGLAVAEVVYIKYRGPGRPSAVNALIKVRKRV